MKLLTFQGAHGAALGGVVGESVVALRPALSAAMRAAGEADRSAEIIPGDMVALLRNEAAMTAAGRALVVPPFKPESVGGPAAQAALATGERDR
jgi:hypothetical protein